MPETTLTRHYRRPAAGGKFPGRVRLDVPNDPESDVVVEIPERPRTRLRVSRTYRAGLEARLGQPL